MDNNELENKNIEQSQNETTSQVSKKGKKIALAVVLTIVIILLILVILCIAFFKSKFSKIQYIDLDESDLSINTDLYNNVSENITEDEFNQIKTIVLYGVDSRNIDNAYANSRSDSLMIASINPTTKSIKLISIPRDTYVNVPGYGYTKINHAFAYGQEQLSIKTINENFGLNISEFITIDFSGLVEVIDALGGIDLTITEDEMEFINKAIDYTAKYSNGDNSKLTNYGTVHLNGTQVLAHCRNRYVGNNDFRRAERQREVIIKVIEDIFNRDILEINSLTDKLLPCITTNIDVSNYINYLPEILNAKSSYQNNIVSVQIPSLDYAGGQMIDGIYYFVSDIDTAKQDMLDILYKN